MIALLSGNEPYLIQFYRKKFEEDIQLKEMNIYFANTFDDNCRVLAQQYPLVDSKRVIFLSLDELNDNDLLLDYVNHPVATTDLIMTSASIDKRGKLYKKLKSMDAIQEYNKFDLKKLKAFILSIIKNGHVSITEDGYQHLIDRINYIGRKDCTLYTVKTYVEQLLYAGDVITTNLVDDIIEKSIDENSFVLSSYLIKKNAIELFELLDSLLLNKESPIAILSLLLRNFRLAYKIAINNGDMKIIASEIGVTTFQIGLYKDLGLPVINSCMDLLQGSVNRIKSGAKGDIVLKLTFCKILSLL